MVVDRCGAVDAGQVLAQFDVPADDGHDDVAAGREDADEFGGDLSRLVGRKEMHGHREDQADRLVKIEEFADAPVVEDFRWVAQVPGAGEHARAAGQEVPRVAEDLGVVVDVGDPGIRLDGLGGFVGVRGGRQPAANVNKLPDAHASHIGDSAGLELPGLNGQLRGLRENLKNLLGLFPVGGEVVLAAEQDIVDPGDARLLGAELGFRHAQFGAQPVHRFGLGEPGLHAGTDGVGDIEQPVADDALVDAVLGAFELQHLQPGTDRQSAFRHGVPLGGAELAGFRPVVHAKVRVRVSVPPGPARPSRTVKASRRAASSRPGGMCRQAIAHGACDRHACHHWPALS